MSQVFATVATTAKAALRFFGMHRGVTDDALNGFILNEMVVHLLYFVDYKTVMGAGFVASG